MQSAADAYQQDIVHKRARAQSGPGSKQAWHRMTSTDLEEIWAWADKPIQGPCSHLATKYGKSFTGPSRNLHGITVTFLGCLLGPKWVRRATIDLQEELAKSYRRTLSFTGTLAGPSRIFTDAGNEQVPCHLHGYLHGTFTDLHGCGVFESATVTFRVRSILGLISRSHQITF